MRNKPTSHRRFAVTKVHTHFIASTTSIYVPDSGPLDPRSKRCVCAPAEVTFRTNYPEEPIGVPVSDQLLTRPSKCRPPFGFFTVSSGGFGDP
jgi:hypothetical protein